MSFPTSYNPYELKTVQFGSSGDYTAVNDAYTASPTPGGAYPDVTRSGQPLVQPGTRVRVFSSLGGPPVVLVYGRYNPTAHVALSAANVPGLVYWKATDGFTVTPTYSENVAAGVKGFEAGILLNPNVGDGNFTWVQTGGICPGVNCPAGTVAGDGLQGGAGTALVLTRVAAATLATAYLPGIIALAASAQVNGKNTVLLQQIGML